MVEPDVRPITRLQRYAVTALVLVALLMVGGSIFIWSGYYNVSASRDHWGVTTWLLTQVRDQSIRARADGIAVPDLSDPGRIALGAEHFRSGCVTCHGSVEGEQNPIYANMLPRPPDLRYAAEDYEPEALFWIVNSGLKYTGMPAWPAAERPDEVWAVVAFLEALNAEGASAMPEAVATASDAATRDAQPPRNCIRCHGDAETSPVGALVPSLNGQSPAYLQRALHEYADGTRQSGYMAPIANGVSDQAMEDLADYYGDLPVHQPPPSDAAAVDLGGQIAANGDADHGIPACDSCHAGTNPQFPRLAGQSADYMEVQLALWRQGLRRQTGYAAVMAAIGTRLTSDQAKAAAAYYASLDAAPGPS